MAKLSIDINGSVVSIDVDPEELETLTYEEDLDFVNCFFNKLTDDMKELFINKKMKELYEL